MSKVSSKAICQKYFGCTPTTISKVVIFTFSLEILEGFKDKYDTITAEFKGWHTGFSGLVNGKEITVLHTGVGSSIIGDCTIVLKHTPCKIVLYTGSIGGLHNWMNIGDIVIPTEAIIGEGFSQYHSGCTDNQFDNKVSLDDELLHFLLPEVKKQSCEIEVSCHVGRIFTTASLMAETKQFLSKLITKDCLGIDMETSAFYMAAKSSQLKALAIHYISDLPLYKNLFNGITEQDRIKRELIKAKMPEIVLSLAEKCYDL